MKYCVVSELLARDGRNNHIAVVRKRDAFYGLAAVERERVAVHIDAIRAGLSATGRRATVGGAGGDGFTAEVLRSTPIAEVLFVSAGRAVGVGDNEGLVVLGAVDAGSEAL